MILLEAAGAEAAAGVAAGLEAEIEAMSGKKARVEEGGSWSEDDDGDGQRGGGRRRRCSGEGAAGPAEGAEGAEDGDEDRGAGRFTAMASIDSRLANCCMSNAIAWSSSRPQPSLSGRLSWSRLMDGRFLSSV